MESPSTIHAFAVEDTKAAQLEGFGVVGGPAELLVIARDEEDAEGR